MQTTSRSGRELVTFPPGDNSSDTVINNVHFDLTTLKNFQFVLYSNLTISNESRCYLIFEDFQPHLLANGTWLNATSCYVPYYSIRTRGISSIIFGTLFGLSLILTLVNLRKHGRLHLRESKRFRAVGRRWQWYWMLYVAGCGMISTLTGVDVDRFYLQGLPIVLQSAFFALMFPGALAVVWESTRHWGSWQERQIVDEDSFALRQDDKRAQTQFWLPLIFYPFAWLNFFMTIPRPWTPLEKQSTSEQIEQIARPAATGLREKAGAILAAFAFVVTCYSLWHSLRCYRHFGSIGRKGVGQSLRDFPIKLIVIIGLLAIRIGYGIASAWHWNLNLSNANVSVGWPFGLGYAPILLIIIVLEIAGFMEENEDRILLRQRRARGTMHDRALGIAPKPNWWSENWAQRYASDEWRLKNLAREAGARRAAVEEHDMEMDHLKKDMDDAGESSTEDAASKRAQGRAAAVKPSALPVTHNVKAQEASVSKAAAGALGKAQNQKIQSMLDI